MTSYVQRDPISFLFTFFFCKVLFVIEFLIVVGHYRFPKCQL